MAPSYTLAVMGVTGAGKSSFIRLVTGDTSIKVGHTQHSETQVISSHVVNIRGSKFTLIDTPGFDDTNLTDTDVLKLLVNWLTSSYTSGQKLNGILYIHRLTDARMRGSSVRNLKMFKELIGDNFYSSVTLGTSCWSLVTSELGTERENELKNGSEFWKTLLAKGANLERIPDTSTTQARELVYKIARNDGVALNVQTEIVDLGKRLEDLRVAEAVNFKLEQMRARQEAERRAAQEARRAAERVLEQQRERELQQIREKNRRIQGFRERQARCQRNVPFGRCDKYGCDEKLKRWEVVFHCCSCSSDDQYWQCGGCGNDCGVGEHPPMQRIEMDDDCIIM